VDAVVAKKGEKETRRHCRSTEDEGEEAGRRGKER